MPRPPRHTSVCIRVDAAEKALIDRAAEVLRTSVSAFVVEASVQRARAVLTDRTRFSLSARQLRAFMDALDAPLPNPDALKTLLNHEPPWEQG